MKISTYNEAKTYLESFIRPMLFKKIIVKDGLTYDPLDRFRTLLKLIDNPQNRFKAVHVSGTSGKGSTSYLISRILTTSGYKTGLTISPHLERLNERMQIDSHQISNEDFTNYLNALIPVIEKMKALPCGEPSYFEILLAISFSYFANQQVDIAVVEVGIEGRYDATLLVQPLVTVITNISLDHTAILGNTQEAIAQEAVAIIKKNIPLVSGVKQRKIQEIIRKTAVHHDAPVFFVATQKNVHLHNRSHNTANFTFSSSQGRISSIRLSLIGEFQLENAANAIQTAFLLRTMGFAISDEHIKIALSTAHFPGRFEIIPGSPEILLDGAHNVAKMQAFLTSLVRIYSKKEKIFVVAFKKDKDITKLLSLIAGKASTLYITEFQGVTDMSSRAATSISDLKIAMKQTKGFIGEVFYFQKSFTAINEAKKLALARNGVVVVTGSLYLVGEVRASLL